MGGWAWSERCTVEDCWAIDVSLLKKNGLLSRNKVSGIEWRNEQGKITCSIGVESNVSGKGSEDDYIRLFYALTQESTGETETFDYEVKVTTSQCNFGGNRYWFLCPNVTNGEYCNRKVSKLFLPPDSMRFACRKCHELIYRSQKERDITVEELLNDPTSVLEKLSTGRTRDSIHVKRRVKRLNVKK